MQHLSVGYVGIIRRCVFLSSYMLKHGEIDYMTAREHLGISIRTYWRDIERLRDSGLRIEADRSHGNTGRVVFVCFELDMPRSNLAIHVGGRAA